MTLSEYLRSRKLSLDPVAVELNQLTPEEKNIVSGIDPNALNLLVQSRINAIGNELLNNATPEEVIVLRLVIYPVANSAEVVTQMQVSGRLYSR